ncbi:MAG: YfiR family protein [Bacteroidales bacterium]|nr:YfiR family protein [Bacteroidales bacterium]
MFYSKQFTFFLFLLVFSFGFKQSSAQLKSKETIRAEWIFNIADGVTWENEQNIDTFTIGVFSSEKMYIELKESAKTKKIKGKSVKIIRYLNYNDIKANNIVYVSKNENAYLGFVYQKLKGKNVLIISDRSHQPQFSILNFDKIGETKPFLINDKLAVINHIKISKQLLKIGSNREVLQKIYSETNGNLQITLQELKEKDKETDSLKQVIKTLEKLLKKYEDSDKTKK